ncbi:MAG: His-Xaa-Ser system radical SAM maturase HxsB, partial [Acidobacteria bacterium]|nr:His-Xaa-Ser system radical SAM maturase HxsB [Acidobacteriota bacterium]
RCDHSCRYCQVSRVSTERRLFDMSESTARRAVELMFRSPAPALKVEIQGGEPLLNFELIRWIVEEVLDRNRTEGRDIQFVVASNLAPLTDEMLRFFAEHRVALSTSLDGPEALHNANRPRPGRDSYRLAVEGIERAREALGLDQVSALMTTTARGLEIPDEIVDEYVRLGFDSIFLRPISPYGFAVRTGEAGRVEADRFLAFYRAALDRVLEWNRRGKPITEVYAQILLTKILTPFSTGYVDLQSPAGLGIAAVVYNYDGDVYASDEARMLAEMGDRTFRLGNVHRDDWQSIFGGEGLRSMVASSIAESLPGCSECAFLPFCGSDPVFHHRTQGDLVGHRPTSAFCHRNMEIIRLLLDRWRHGDAPTRETFLRWASGAEGEAEEVHLVANPPVHQLRSPA